MQKILDLLKPFPASFIGERYYETQPKTEDDIKLYPEITEIWPDVDPSVVCDTIIGLVKSTHRPIYTITSLHLHWFLGLVHTGEPIDFDAEFYNDYTKIQTKQLDPSYCGSKIRPIYTCVDVWDIPRGSLDYYTLCEQVFAPVMEYLSNYRDPGAICRNLDTYDLAEVKVKYPGNRKRNRK